MSTTGLDALTWEVNTYKDIRYKLPSGPQAEVQRLLLSHVIAEGYMLIDLQRDRLVLLQARERWEYWVEQYDECLNEHLAAEDSYTGIDDSAAAYTRKQRLYDIAKARLNAENDLDVAKQGYLGYGRKIDEAKRNFEVAKRKYQEYMWPAVGRRMFSALFKPQSWAQALKRFKGGKEEVYCI
ncbi:hypothetical protein H4R19_002999 [Coemansia spiralis]|nr:hypothetical protein H4R19_002999 [Coemansia spiralis]